MDSAVEGERGGEGDKKKKKSETEEGLIGWSVYQA